MNPKEKYFLLRRSKKITLTEIAKYIGCSQSLLSRYETNDCGMCNIKIQKYKQYIDLN